MNETTPRIVGEFEWSDSKSIHIQARFDEVALHENRLVFISLVAFSQDVKALRAAFAAGLDAPMRLKNVELERDDETVVPGDVRPVLGGYRLDTHRLGFGSIHALFICRQPGFLPNDSDDALWQELQARAVYDSAPSRVAPVHPQGAGAQEPALPLSHPRLHLLHPDRHVRRPGLDRRVRAQERHHPHRTGSSDPMNNLDQMTIDDYFREFSHFHVKKATELLEPLHVPGQDPLPDFSDTDPPAVRAPGPRHRGGHQDARRDPPRHDRRRVRNGQDGDGNADHPPACPAVGPEGRLQRQLQGDRALPRSPCQEMEG